MPIHLGDFNTGLENMKATIRRLPPQLGAEAEVFFKSNFDVQGWQGDNGLQLWDKRKRDKSTRRILIGKGTAHLKNGLRKFVSGQNISVRVTGVAAKYADAHNFGETIFIPVTSKLRKFAWAMYFKLGGTYQKAATTTMGERSTWNAGVSSSVNFWKFIAITRKSHLFLKIPQRKFIGNSKMLDNRLHALIERKLTETKV